MNEKLIERYANVPKGFEPFLTSGTGQSMLIASRAAEITPASDSPDNNVFNFNITTTQIDRYNDVVQSVGGKLDNYKLNPVVLWNHDSWSHPIGRSMNQTVNATSIVADAMFHGETEDSRLTLTLLQKGYLKATSIGFVPMEWIERTPTEDEQTYYSNWTNVVREYTAWDLLEFSIVTVPANAGAVMTNAMLSKDPFIKALRSAYDDNVINFEMPSVRKALSGLNLKSINNFRPIIKVQHIPRKTKMLELTDEQKQQVVAEFPPAVATGFKDYLISAFEASEEDATATAALMQEAITQLLPEILSPAADATTTEETVTNAFKSLAGAIDKKGAKLSAKNKALLEEAMDFNKKASKTIKAVIDAAADGEITDDEVDDIADSNKSYLQRIKALESKIKDLTTQQKPTDEVEVSSEEEVEAFFADYV